VLALLEGETTCTSCGHKSFKIVAFDDPYSGYDITRLQKLEDLDVLELMENNLHLKEHIKS
jgi:hypothetical protein